MPEIDPENRFYAETIEGMNSKIDDEGFATGMDVWPQVKKAYLWYLNGDGELADAQLESFMAAVREP